MRFMRTVGPLALGCLLGGCSGGGPEAPTGHIAFTLDAVTCVPQVGGDSLRFFVDGTRAASATLSPGQSVIIETKGGQHDVAVTFANGSILQDHTTITVPDMGEYRDLLQCR